VKKKKKKEEQQVVLSFYSSSIPFIFYFHSFKQYRQPISLSETFSKLLYPLN